MFRNSELWMFSCQVRHQSVENGNWPLEGDLPAISLYRRIRRSYDSGVSDSSTCMRAPIWISMAARSICFDSFSTLLAGALAVDLAAGVAVMAGSFQETGRRGRGLGKRIRALQTRGWPSGCWRAAYWSPRCPPSWWCCGWSADSRPGCHPHGKSTAAYCATPASSPGRPKARRGYRRHPRSDPDGRQPRPCPGGSASGPASGRWGWLRGFRRGVVRWSWWRPFQSRVVRCMPHACFRDPLKWIVNWGQTKLKSGTGCASCLVSGGACRDLPDKPSGGRIFFQERADSRGFIGWQTRLQHPRENSPSHSDEGPRPLYPDATLFPCKTAFLPPRASAPYLLLI